MSDSLLGVMGAGSAPDRSTSSSCLRVVELLLGVARAHRDGGLAAADLRLDDGRRVDDVVEDDGEAAVDVGARDLLEAIGARRARRTGARSTARSPAGPARCSRR